MRSYSERAWGRRYQAEELDRQQARKLVKQDTDREMHELQMTVHRINKVVCERASAALCGGNVERRVRKEQEATLVLVDTRQACVRAPARAQCLLGLVSATYRPEGLMVHRRGWWWWWGGGGGRLRRRLEWLERGVALDCARLHFSGWLTRRLSHLRFCRQ